MCMCVLYKPMLLLRRYSVGPPPSELYWSACCNVSAANGGGEPIEGQAPTSKRWNLSYIAQKRGGF